jgi:hypothetical protein
MYFLEFSFDRNNTYFLTGYKACTVYITKTFRCLDKDYTDVNVTLEMLHLSFFRMNILNQSVIFCQNPGTHGDILHII